MRGPIPRQLALFALVGILAASARAETCYSYSGFKVEDQQFCKGSGACCGVNDECMPNRLCKSRGAADNVLVRGPCSSRSWDKTQNCAEICNFNEVEQNTGLQDGVFPRVEICDEGVYCCRQGSVSCCDRPNRLVFLNEDGVRLSARPSSTAATTSSRPTSTESTSAESPDTTPTDPVQSNSSSKENTSGGSQDSDNSLGLKVGLGVGIPVAILITALATWWFTSRRHKGAESHGSTLEPVYEQPHESMKQQIPSQYYVPYGQMTQPHQYDPMGRDSQVPQELESPPNPR